MLMRINVVPEAAVCSEIPRKQSPGPGTVLGPPFDGYNRGGFGIHGFAGSGFTNMAVSVNGRSVAAAFIRARHAAFD